jgi:hypothetical protein
VFGLVLGLRRFLRMRNPLPIPYLMWRTYYVQVPVFARTWRFDSSWPHFFHLSGSHSTVCDGGQAGRALRPVFYEISRAAADGVGSAQMGLDRFRFASSLLRCAARRSWVFQRYHITHRRIEKTCSTSSMKRLHRSYRHIKQEVSTSLKFSMILSG